MAHLKVTAADPSRCIVASQSRLATQLQATTGPLSRSADGRLFVDGTWNRAPLARTVCTRGDGLAGVQRSTGSRRARRRRRARMKANSPVPGGGAPAGGSCPAELPAFQDATIPGAGVLCLTISRRASLLLPPTGGQRCRCPIRRLCESPTLEYDSSGGAHPCATSSLTDDQRGATPLARFGQLPPSWLCRRDPRDCSLIAAESTELRIPSLDSLRDKSVSALPSVERGASEVKPAVPGWARGRSRGWRGASRLWKKKTQGGKKLEAGDGDDAGYHRTRSTAKRPGLEQVGRWSTPGGQGHTLRSCTPSSAGPRNQATGDRGCGVVICTVCTSGIAGSRRPPGSRLCDGSSNFFFPNSGGRCHLFPRRILPLSRSHGRSVARTRDKLPAPRPHLCNPRAPDLVSPGLRPVFPAPLVVDPSCRKDTRA